MMGEVYAICDPVTDEIRYVGMTMGNGFKRLARHMFRASHGGKTHLHNWLRTLTALPNMKILETANERDVLANREIEWIARLRALGVRLTNIVDGGEGFRGNHSLESRAKMSMSHRGRKHSGGAVPSDHNAMKRPEVRAKISAARKGHGNPMYGRKHSIETRIKMSHQIPWNKGQSKPCACSRDE